MIIYLIRHGETKWNLESRVQGREDVPLTEEGVRQAERAAEALRGSVALLSAVLTSPLQRAVRTAETFSRIFHAPLVTEERLIERDFGSASGMVIDIFHPERYADDLEPLEQVAERMEAALLEHASNLPGDFAAVSHGGSINALLWKLSGGEVGTGKTRLRNASVNVLVYENGALTIEACNLDASELKR